MKEIHKPRMTANMAMVTDSNGIPSASTNITKTELGMLNNIRTNVQTQIDNLNTNLTAKSMVPDYSKRVGVSSEFTATSNGYFTLYVSGSWSGLSISINDVWIIGEGGQEDNVHGLTLPVAAGDKITFSSGSGHFIPCK